LKSASFQLGESQFDKAVPGVDCIIIGVNSSTTLGRCIESILQSNYPLDLIQIYYVDGGSTDNSLPIAKGYPEVDVIELHPQYPTPGMGRNAGWKKGSAPLVQFLDSDTILHPDWLSSAVQAMKDNVGAVRGNREEIHPEASIFNMIANLEWNAPPGECEAFGGDVMIRRSLLQETQGYDEILVGGEDPELSQRLRLLGFKIIQLDAPMTRHDIAMTKIRQYWKRAFRTGYGYAAVTSRYLKDTKSFWARELFRLTVRGGLSLILLSLGLIGSLWHHWWLGLWLPGFFLLFWPRLCRVSYFAADKKISGDSAKIYAWHCSLVVIPEFLGAARYVVGAITGHPLRNMPSQLKTIG
jgi:glycosyltransferase involved in cell wall biosynthesis